MKRTVSLIVIGILVLGGFGAVAIPFEEVNTDNKNPSSFNSGGLPDFIIYNLSSSYSILKPTHVTVTVSISNIGDPVEEGPIQVIVNLTWVGYDKIPPTQVDFEYIGVGPTKDQSVLMEIPANHSQPVLYIKAEVDPDNQYPESNEQNNEKTISVKRKIKNSPISYTGAIKDVQRNAFIIVPIIGFAPEVSDGNITYWMIVWVTIPEDEFRGYVGNFILFGLWFVETPEP